MIGLVLVTWGRLGAELKAAMEHVVGPQRNMECLGLDPKRSPYERRAELEQIVREVDDGAGVILLTDALCGASGNLARTLLDPERVEVIPGVNLPMLVKLAKARGSRTLFECVELAEAAGYKYTVLRGD